MGLLQALMNLCNLRNLWIEFFTSIKTATRVTYEYLPHPPNNLQALNSSQPRRIVYALASPHCRANTERESLPNR